MTIENQFLIVAKSFFKDEDIGNYQIKKLLGDASSRSYYRINYKEKSYLLCLNDPENKKQNEEFIYWSKQYSKNKIRVPEVYFHEPGLLLQEDFGDQSLLVRTQEEKSNNKKIIYKKSIDELVKIHQIQKDPNKKYDSFNEEKLFYEINMTLDYFVKQINEVSESQINTIRNYFKPVVQEILKQEYVISHRDYHSKNILIDKNEKICIIDFQDSMLGARQYDLCSLVDDRYVHLDQEMKEELIKYYCSSVDLNCSEDEFNHIYDYSMIQRTFKAIGSFSYQFIKNNNLSYLPFINSSMESLISVLENHPELGKLKNSLYSYRYEG